MARNTTDSYWQARAEERLVASEQTGKAYYKQIEAAYNQALRNLEDSLQELYDAYYNRNTLSFDLNELNVNAASGTLERFRSLVTEAGLVLPAEYQGRLSRLEHLYAQAWFEAQKAGQTEYAQSSQLYSDVYQRAYYTSGQATIVSTGTSRALSTLDRRAVDQVLNTKFYGKNYSERIWANTNTFAKELKETLSAAIASGESPVKTARKLRERFDVRKYYAERLVRTETNYFHNQAELDSYSALGIDEYKILATLDARTSEVCQEMDGKTFKVSKAEVGVNYPPFHPNCRTTTIAAVEGLIGDTEKYRRGARDVDGNPVMVAYGTTYGDWANEYAGVGDLTFYPSDLDGSTLPNGLIGYDASLMDEYDKIGSASAPSDLYTKYRAATNRNPYGDDLTAAEVSLVSRAEALLGEQVGIIEPSATKPTPDFLMLGHGWELKTPISTKENTIRNTLWKITDQGKQYAIIDVSFMNRPLSWVFERLDLHFSESASVKELEEVIIVRGNKFIRYK